MQYQEQVSAVWLRPFLHLFPNIFIFWHKQPEKAGYVQFFCEEIYLSTKYANYYFFFFFNSAPKTSSYNHNWFLTLTYPASWHMVVRNNLINHIFLIFFHWYSILYLKFSRLFTIVEKCQIMDEKLKTQEMMVWITVSPCGTMVVTVIACCLLNITSENFTT